MVFNIAAGYTWRPEYLGLTLLNPFGYEVYFQPGDEENDIRTDIETIDEIEEAGKRAILAERLLGEYF